jgi:5,10-methylenetetrahydromethanopterin reductase
MAVKIGITFFPDRPDRFTQWVQMAESAGFDLLGIADSQSLYRELYVGMTLAALKTQRIRLGPRVSNPVTRHPAVTASAMASIEELAPGRTLLGLGTGDSALAAVGLRGVRLAELEAYVQAVRALVQGEPATWQGHALRMPWSRMRIPIYLSAHGPRSLRLAGAIADGVIVGTGFSPEVVPDTLAHIRAGAEGAGRRLEDLDVWWWCHLNVADDREAALQDVLPALAAAGNHLTRFTAEGKHIPPNLLEAAHRLHREYQVESHFSPGAQSANAELVIRLGLRDYLAERFAVAGTAEECVARLLQLAAMGVTQLWTAASFTDKLKFMRDWAERVFPHVR